MRFVHSKHSTLFLPCRELRNVIFRMGYLILAFLILSFSSPSYSENLHPVDEENTETVMLAISHQEENQEAAPLDSSVKEKSENAQGSSVVEISDVNSGLSQDKLTEIHDLAKSISHSKGIYRENGKDSGDEPEVRRSILKKAAVASESDIMRVIVERISTDENQLQLLEQLEYLVHQYDVAVDFATSGGIKLITPLLLSSDEKIAASAALVLGSAMQSNPTVQKFAMNDGCAKKLVDLLIHKSPEVLSRAIFALASLLRNAPEAQGEFIAMNGVSRLVDLLKSRYVTTNTKLKILNLFSDIVIEHKTADMYESTRNSEEIEALKRSFESEIQKFDVCSLIPPFLDFEDFDTHQKTVAAMISLYSTCHDDFKVRKITWRLRYLIRLYSPLTRDHDPIYPDIDLELKLELLNELLDLISLILDEHMGRIDEQILRDEL